MSDIFSTRDWGVLKSPPIIQAAMEIRFDGIGEDWIDNYENYYGVISDDFPQKKKQMGQGIEINLAQLPQISPVAHTGYVFQSSNSLNSIIITKDKFIFVDSSNYKTWDKFESEAKKMWNLFVKYASPETITRRSIRYINRILLPFPIGEIGDWLKTALIISPDLPNIVESYQVSFSYAFQEKNIVANVTQIAEQPEGSQLPFLFDIDIIDLNHIPTSDVNYWNTFQTLRTLKNNIFFLGLTENTIKLFK